MKISLEQTIGKSEEQLLKERLAQLEQSSPAMAATAAILRKHIEGNEKVAEVRPSKEQQHPTPIATPLHEKLSRPKRPFVSFLERSLPPGDRD